MFVSNYLVMTILSILLKPEEIYVKTLVLMEVLWKLQPLRIMDIKLKILLQSFSNR